MKMHDYKGWRIGVDADRNAGGSPRAMATMFEPGTGPRDHTGIALGLHRVGRDRPVVPVEPMGILTVHRTARWIGARASLPCRALLLPQRVARGVHSNDLAPNVGVLNLRVPVAADSARPAEIPPNNDSRPLVPRR